MRFPSQSCDRKILTGPETAPSKRRQTPETLPLLSSNHQYHLHSANQCVNFRHFKKKAISVPAKDWFFFSTRAIFAAPFLSFSGNSE
jgi:hypothetical protein